MKTKITLKTAIKAKNVLTKCWKILLGKNETKLTCFDFVVKKGKITLVTLVWLEKPCFENYVEMVAGLPRKRTKNENIL